MNIALNPDKSCETYPKTNGQFEAAFIRGFDTRRSVLQSSIWLLRRNEGIGSHVISEVHRDPWR
jgi:hypothetical protein